MTQYFSGRLLKIKTLRKTDIFIPYLWEMFTYTSILKALHTVLYWVQRLHHVIIMHVVKNRIYSYQFGTRMMNYRNVILHSNYLYACIHISVHTFICNLSLPPFVSHMYSLACPLTISK